MSELLTAMHLAAQDIVALDLRKDERPIVYYIDDRGYVARAEIPKIYLDSVPDGSRLSFIKQYKGKDQILVESARVVGVAIEDDRAMFFVRDTSRDNTQRLHLAGTFIVENIDMDNFIDGLLKLKNGQWQIRIEMDGNSKATLLTTAGVSHNGLLDIAARYNSERLSLLAQIERLHERAGLEPSRPEDGRDVVGQPSRKLTA